MKAEEYERRRATVAGWEIDLTSYRLGQHYHCVVENVAVGARIARGDGESRELAEAAALRKTTTRLEATRRMPAV